MDLKRIAGTAFLVCYLWVTLAAFVTTVLRVPPAWPRPLVAFAYGMMAPYQSASTALQEIRAEGRMPDGTWQAIDLDPSFPVLFGERNLREFSIAFRQDGYFRSSFARALLNVEQRQGKDIDGIRLWLDGQSLIDESDIDSTLLVEVYDEQ